MGTKKNKMRFFIFIFIFSFFSCKTTEEIKYVEKIKIQYVDKLKVDSIYKFERDSFFSYTKGDTVFTGKLSKVYHYKFQYLKDSLNNRDTIRTETILKVPVQRSLTKSQKFLIEVGKWSLIILTILIIYFGRKLFTSVRKNILNNLYK